MNPLRRSPTFVLGATVCLSLAGCGGMRSLTDRLLHRNSCDCEPVCSSCSSVPMGIPVGQPVMLPPGYIPQPSVLPPGVIPGQAFPAAPPVHSMKIIPDQQYPTLEEKVVEEPTPSEPTLPPIDHPAPPPRRTPSVAEKAPEPKAVEPPAPALVPPAPPVLTPPAPPVLTPPAPATSGSITLKLTGDKLQAAVGDTVTIEITIQNQGSSAIDSVDMAAEFSGNLRPQTVSPEGTGTIKGSSVSFQPIRSFSPMSLTYRIATQITGVDGGMGRVSVEVKSPALAGGPLKKELSLSITGGK